jgi:hypothetical protein
VPSSVSSIISQVCHKLLPETADFAGSTVRQEVSRVTARVSGDQAASGAVASAGPALVVGSNRAPIVALRSLRSAFGRCRAWWVRNPSARTPVMNLYGAD